MPDVASSVPAGRLASPAGLPPTNAGSGRPPEPPWVGPAGPELLDAAGAAPPPGQGTGAVAASTFARARCA
eukprot:15444096-Alexandrium_andersonii.AAC.1